MLGRSPFRLLLWVRCLLLAGAAGAAIAGFAILRSGGTKEVAGGVAYACPMHPQVRSPAPGTCPICRMALERANGSSTGAPSHAHAHPEGNAPEVPHEPVPTGSFSIPSLPAFRAFDAVSRAKVHPLSLEMRGPAAIDEVGSGVALFFLDEGELVAAGEEGWFSPTGEPPSAGATGHAVRVGREPPRRWDARTVLVRFDVRDSKLVPGTTGSLKLTTRIRQGLVVKASAIVASPAGPQVFVVSNDRRTFTRRHVEIGNVVHGLAAVVSGLSQDENVAAKHALALEAEWQAHQGISL
jgi:hypothetical protein